MKTSIAGDFFFKRKQKNERTMNMFTKLKMLPVMALGIFCIGISEGNAVCNVEWTDADCRAANTACQAELNKQVKKSKKVTDGNAACKYFNTLTNKKNIKENADCPVENGYSMCMAQIPLEYPTYKNFAHDVCEQEGYVNCWQWSNKPNKQNPRPSKKR